MIFTDKILTAHQARQYSPLTLAFIGDAVFEQFIRDRLVICANMPVRKLHNLAVKRVCAEYQSRATRELESKELLSETELEILYRGRNASGITAPKHSTIAEYRNATALECLLGYLHLIGENERAEEICRLSWDLAEKGDENAQ